MPVNDRHIYRTGRKMDYNKQDLVEAKRQIDSTLHKLSEVVKTFEAKEQPKRYKSQITLAKRRIQAFEIANDLLENELKKESFLDNKKEENQ